MFQKLGLVKDYFADRGTPITDADLGRYNVTKQDYDKYFFKVPTLRNVELTAPYLHDGSQATLEDTVRVMGTYQLGRELTDAQVNSIVTFLKSLTGELPAHAKL
jgi:cytochrome c peroxidase